MELITPQWRKSTRSADNGGNCVEIAVLTAAGDDPTRDARP